MNSALELIAAERQRQIDVELFHASHDDLHNCGGELLDAAIQYATTHMGAQSPCRRGWPWHHRWWKPSDDPVRNLVKAAALIAAEIDRLQRLKP